MIKTDVFGTFLFSIGHGPMYMNIIFRSPIVDREQKRTNPISLLDLDWLVEVRRDFRRWASSRLERPNNRGPWRQTAGFKALRTSACGQCAWSKLPRGDFRRLAGKRQA